MKRKSYIAGALVLPAAAGFELGFFFGPKLVGALLLLAAWAAAAQPQGGLPSDQGNEPALQQGDQRPPPPGPRHRHPRPSITKALDTNSDGIIDANEIANAPAALKGLDKNGDGKLTVEEYIGPWAAGANGPRRGPDGRPPPIPPIVKVLDKNGDGIIDAGEIANASAALKTLDKNGDGKLTPDEYRPPWPPPPDRGALSGGPPDGGPPDGPPPGSPPDGPPPGDPPDGPPPQ